MKNEYIEVVKRWLAGEVFSAEALRANTDTARDTSRAAADAADAAAAAVAAADAADAAAYAAYAAAAAVDAAVDAADAAANDAADYWVKRYEELTNDK